MEINLKLEETCRSCHGTGNHTEFGPSGSSRPGRTWAKKGDMVIYQKEGGCQCCDGTGRELTEFGGEVLDFVRRRLNAKAVELDEVKQG